MVSFSFSFILFYLCYLINNGTSSSITIYFISFIGEGQMFIVSPHIL
jgi:uncharacterized MAPEG superfamily protein